MILISFHHGRLMAQDLPTPVPFIAFTRWTRVFTCASRWDPEGGPEGAMGRDFLWFWRFWDDFLWCFFFPRFLGPMRVFLVVKIFKERFSMWMIYECEWTVQNVAHHLEILWVNGLFMICKPRGLSRKRWSSAIGYGVPPSLSNHRDWFMTLWWTYQTLFHTFSWVNHVFLMFLWPVSANCKRLPEAIWLSRFLG